MWYGYLMHTTQTHTTSTVRSVMSGGDLAIAAEVTLAAAAEEAKADRRLAGFLRRQAVTA